MRPTTVLDLTVDKLLGEHATQRYAREAARVACRHPRESVARLVQATYLMVHTDARGAREPCAFPPSAEFSRLVVADGLSVEAGAPTLAA